MKISTMLVRGLCASALLLAQAAQAHGIDALAMFRSLVFAQNTDASALPAGAYFSASAFVDEADLYTTGQLTLPDASARVLVQTDTGLEFNFQSALLPDRAALDAAYAGGTYGVTLTHEPTGDNIASSIAFAAALYPTSTPFLGGNSFSRLQGMDAASAITLDINPLLNAAAAPDAAWVSFHVYDADHSLAFSSSLLPASTLSLDLPGSSLQAGQSYRFELVYSNRVFTLPPAPFEPAGTLGFDLRTQGSFTTAVPEPGSFGLMALGLLALHLGRRRACG